MVGAPNPPLVAGAQLQRIGALILAAWAVALLHCGQACYWTVTVTVVELVIDAVLESDPVMVSV